VASLTTIGTPHRGTPLATLGSVLLGETLGLGALLSRVGLSLDAIHDLSTARLEQFERQTPDAPSVRYACVLAAVAPEGPPVHPLLRPSRALLSQFYGPNDGLVPVDSQRHGQVLEEIQADHWAEIGWSNGFDAPALYERLLRRLRRMGL
jgi:triacylglycerol esterase/lipase EstA (alpha/beta hydrolase family)